LKFSLRLCAFAGEILFMSIEEVHLWRGSPEQQALRSQFVKATQFAYFDEQLDRYMETGVVGPILPEYVGLSPEKRDVSVHRFRAYYVDTGVFELLGKHYEIEPLAKETGLIHEQLRKMDRNGGRLLQCP